jgi:hypothetical protein
MLTDAQLEELYDKQKLHENLMLYARGIDRYDAELIKSTYWPDSTDDHGGFIGPGQDWAAAGCAWRDKVYNCNHHVSNVLIELDGNRAKRESMYLNVVNQKEPAVSWAHGGRYRDLCEKRDGEWRVLHRVVVWDWCEHWPRVGGWEMCALPQKSNWGGFFPDDPIYKDWTKSDPTDFPRPIPEFFAKFNNPPTS